MRTLSCAGSKTAGEFRTSVNVVARKVVMPSLNANIGALIVRIGFLSRGPL